MFITKKHISRRTVLRGASATLALPLARRDDPGLDGAGANRGHAEASICRLLRAARRGARLLGPQHRRQAGRRASLQLETAGTVRESDRDHERPAFPLGRTASGRDRRRSLGGRGVPVREQTQEDRRRGRVRGNHHRSDHRAKDRPGKPDAVHAARGRGSRREFEQLRRRLQLHLHQHHLLVLADRSAADGAESAGGVRAHVRRRQFASSSAPRGASGTAAFWTP